MKRRSPGAIAVITLVLPCVASAGQMPPIGQRSTPLPEGRTIEARDGDLIVVDNDARVRFVRRRQAVGRLIFNAEERWVVLLADFVPANGSADGAVDFTYNWRDIEGQWPLEARWQGNLVVEDYMSPGFAPSSVGLVLPNGRIQFVSGIPARDGGFSDPQALAVVRYRGGGSSSANQLTFDQIEPKAVAEASSNSRSGSSISTFSAGGVQGAMMMTATPQGAAANAAAMQAPVRPGGQVPMPRKTHDVAPTYPEAMRQSGVGGVVILEVVTAVDGSVAGVKVLRGITPEIDLAALQAARQWRYEPTTLNGVAVPIVFTATVNVRP